MLEIDYQSLLATVDTDLSIEHLAKLLAQHALSFPYYAVPHQKYLLADILTTRVPNLYSRAFGGIEDLCLQISWAQSDGSIWTQVLSPRSATGPNLKKLSLGSGEYFGLPIQAVLRVLPLQEKSLGACLVFPGFQQQEFFKQSLGRNSLQVPLCEEFSYDLARHYISDLSESERVLALAWWGSVRQVDAMANTLKSLTHERKGEFYLVEAGHQDEKFWQTLHHQALKNMEARASLSPEVLSCHHRLQKRLEKIV